MAQLSCQIQGEPKPLLEWILPDGTKVRAPYASEDHRIIISSEGKLTIRGADASDTGVYRCIATNYLDADILIFRVTVLSPDVEEEEVNGAHLSKPLGENLFFDCSSSGSPEASVQWILPDHSVLDKSHGNKKVYENGSLFILGLTARDRGFFRCLAANHLGADLLVTQLTLSEDKPEKLPFLDGEGSGIEDKIDPTLDENTVTLNEIPSSSPYDLNSQESQMVTSDVPYSRLRSHGRGGAGGRLGQRRRGPFRNRWSSRGFGKASRKVDPQTFAEFIKKAQDGSRVRTSTENEQTKYAVSNTSLSGDDENGSGEDHNEDHLTITPTIVQSKANNPQKGMTLGQQNRHPKTSITPQIGHHSKVATTEAYRIASMETISNHINLSQMSENKDTVSTQPHAQSDPTPIKSTFTNSPTKRSEIQRLAVTPNIISHNTGLSGFQLTATDSSQETPLRVSGEQPAEPETSTWAAFSSATDPNVTPMGDSAGPVELVIHTSTDPESQTKFTAVTATERQQGEITFQTTQTIKSSHLPAGSTIISQQKIHIIPHKKGRGGGRRRTFQGRRRIIKPSRITDIQSFINKLKQPPLKDKGNATELSNTELTTGKQTHFVSKRQPL